MFAVERIGRTEVHRHAMLDDAVLFEQKVERLQRLPAIDHEILRDDLEPVDDRFLIEDVLVVWDAQPDADAVVGESVEWIGRQEEFVIASLGLKWPSWMRHTMYYAIIIAIFWFGGHEQQFIYFQF